MLSFLESSLFALVLRSGEVGDFSLEIAVVV